jgi:hypothetical protein
MRPMSTPDPPNVRARSGQAPPTEPERPSALSSAVADAARSAMTSALLERRPYLKYAFANPYNLTLFLGALVAAGLTLNPLLALAALGAESLWLLYAPDSKRLRHLLWDPRFEQVREALIEQERAGRIRVLGDADRARMHALVARQKDIRRLAAANPTFTGELLRAELVKTDRLVEAFLDMAVTCARYEEYLASVDLPAIERDRTRWEVNARAGAADEPQVLVARKNLAVILKRLDKMKEIRRYLVVARGQLDLLENSFQLIADQIVTMQSPQELSGQLDELLDGVESIRQTAIDTDRILGTMGIGTTI